MQLNQWGLFSDQWILNFKQLNARLTFTAAVALKHQLKCGFDRLNLTANLQGISGLAKSSTIGPTPKEAVANMSNTMMIALNQSNDHSHKGADRQSDEGGNNVSSSINSSSLGLNGKLKKRVSKQKNGNSEAP